MYSEFLFSLCVPVPGMLKQMEVDRCRFGAAAWKAAVPRLEKLRFLLAKETLQHMRAAEMCLNRKKGRIREKVCVRSVYRKSHIVLLASAVANTVS